ncbi:MAG: phosphatidylserine decarboxylase [Woeseiaceae bacterium]|nr:phosphatidylserine decarboxylase [Woeseiaceae bacterium]
MVGRRNPFVAREGVPFLLASLILIWAAWRYLPDAWTALPIALTVVLFLVFRDPVRGIPPSALGVVSPVDGKVVEVETVEGGTLLGKAHRIVIEVDALGTYTARSPVEGTVRNLSSAAGGRPVDYATNALWIRTDEGDDVVMGFRGYRFGLPPRALVRYGERLGQGQRCAYLRLVRFVELHVPFEGKVRAEPGQTVVAGSDLVGSVPHH